MKKNILLTALVMFFCQLLQAQEQIVNADFPAIIPSRSFPTFSNSVFLKDTSYTSVYYLQKSKNQETGAWVMLGGGMALSVIGFVGVLSNAFATDNSAEPYAIVALTGFGLALGSIPIFIVSGHNARKAAKLSFKNQPILLPRQNSFGFKSQPTIRIAIPL